MLKRSAVIAVLLTCASPVGAETSQTHARNAFNSMMNAERASTQAIRDSMKFVNRSPVTFGTSSSTPTPVEKKPDPAERHRQYVAMQNAQKVRLLDDLAAQGDVAAMAELGSAMINHEYGLNVPLTLALKYLDTAAQLGDADAAFNAGLAASRLDKPALALQYFEQAANAGVRGAAYQATFAALDNNDYDKVLRYGARAADEGSALSAYAVCLAAQKQQIKDTATQFCPRAYEMGFHEADEDAGLALASSGQWERAYGYFLKCAEARGFASCKRNAGLAALQSYQHDDAIRWLEAAQAMGDNDTDARMMLAIELVQADQKPWDRIEQLLSGLIAERGKQSAQAHFYMAVVYDLRPDREYTDAQINEHLIAAARGGFADAQQALREAGLSW
jgi:hypothetical protein